MTTAPSKCCGIDVRGRTIVACLRDNGRDEIRSYRRSPAEVAALVDWLEASGASGAVYAMTEDAMDSYWTLLLDLLEQRQIPGQVVDPRSLQGEKRSKGTAAQQLTDAASQGLLESRPMPGRADREREMIAQQCRHYQKMLDELAYSRKKLFGRARTLLSMLIPDVRGASMQNLLNETFANGIPDAQRIAALRREGQLAENLKSTPEEIAEAIRLSVSGAEVMMARSDSRLIEDLETRLTALNEVLSR